MTDNHPVERIGDRVRGLSPAARATHQAVLRRFATTGQPPNTEEIGPALRELHAADLVLTDQDGRIHAAYPFSGRPTPHRVRIAGGPTVYAMCAIDALGIADMLDRDITVESTEPQTAAPITVTIQNGQTVWSPHTAVVFVGSSGDGPTAERCCTVMNFFTSPQQAQRWAGAHPTITGAVLTQPQAQGLAAETFGPLLRDDPEQLAAATASNLPDEYWHHGWGTVFRALMSTVAEGRPATVDELSTASGRSPVQIRAGMPEEVERDERDRIVGFGITLNPTQHRLDVNGRTLYAWCAGDALGNLPAIGQTVRVHSTCAATGQPITVVAGPDGISQANPPDAVVTVVGGFEPYRVRASGCSQVNFYASADAAAGWLREHPDGQVLPVADAARWARHTTQLIMADHPPARPTLANKP